MKCLHRPIVVEAEVVILSENGADEAYVEIEKGGKVWMEVREWVGSYFWVGS